nr:exodeoxyribonuclease V subunit gamma [Prolixibacteraceae bacterium]
QLHKEVYSENEAGSRIKVMQALTDHEEGVMVVNELNQHRFTLHDAFSDYAILYRINAQSRIFEEQLRRLNLPYRIYGGLSFYERKEIKDLLAYLRLVINVSDNEALKRIINYPARGIGDTTLGKVEQAAYGSGVSIWEVLCRPDRYPAGLNKGTLGKIEGFLELIQSFRQELAQTSAYETALTVARRSGILEDLYRDKSPENLSKFENVQELLNAIQEFSLNAQEEGRPNRLENYLEEVALITDQDTDKKDDRNRITLMTVHSAKGLEFKNVFIVGLEEKLFPSQYTGYISPEELEEERRLFYVALTRAMKNVWLSYALQRYNWGQLNFCEPSRFIEELDEQYLELPSNRQKMSFFDRMDQDEKIIFDSPKKNVPLKRFSEDPEQSPIRPINQRLTRIKQAQARPSFEADTPDRIELGCHVEHQRFGQGKVIDLEGDDSNRKATVLFETAGRKQLLLKFARLKRID